MTKKRKVNFEKNLQAIKNALLSNLCHWPVCHTDLYVNSSNAKFIDVVFKMYACEKENAYSEIRIFPFKPDWDHTN